MEFFSLWHWTLSYFFPEGSKTEATLSTSVWVLPSKRLKELQLHHHILMCSNVAPVSHSSPHPEKRNTRVWTVYQDLFLSSWQTGDLQDEAVVTKPCIILWDIQTPTHDHTQRITHYCRRLSVVSREMQPSIASVNIANMGTKKEDFCRRLEI
jgi:hypothetical protein